MIVVRVTNDDNCMQPNIFQTERCLSFYEVNKNGSLTHESVYHTILSIRLTFPAYLNALYKEKLFNLIINLKINNLSN